LLTLLTAIDALVDGASTEEAAELIQVKDHDQISTVVSTWDRAAQARIRRRLRRVGSDRPQGVLKYLTAHELLAPLS
jgi:hypothetical protein